MATAYRDPPRAPTTPRKARWRRRSWAVLRGVPGRLAARQWRLAVLADNNAAMARAASVDDAYQIAALCRQRDVQLDPHVVAATTARLALQTGSTFGDVAARIGGWVKWFWC